MSKFKDKVAQISLEVGGSHYPTVNIHLQEAMVKIVVNECIDALANCNKDHVYTTFDQGQHEATLDRAKKSIQERFGL